LTERFIIGQIGSPFGIKGFLKIHSLSGEIGHLLKLESVIVSKDGNEKVLQIEECAPASPAVLMRFNGIDTPEKAKTLVGAQLIVNREQAAPLNEGEFYIEDMKGLPVVTENNLTACGANGQVLGHITDIIEGGGGELVDIELSGGEKKLVPFRHEFFPELNPEKGRVVLQNLWILE
jgi:16S rRNA processing protein RimM